MSYVVYILECADNTYYTGVARDVITRVTEHNNSHKGAKYTRARRPVQLVYTEAAANRSVAQKREYVIRRLSRREKEQLIREQSSVAAKTRA